MLRIFPITEFSQTEEPADNNYMAYVKHKQIKYQYGQGQPRRYVVNNRELSGNISFQT